MGLVGTMLLVACYARGQCLLCVVRYGSAYPQREWGRPVRTGALAIHDMLSLDGGICGPSDAVRQQRM